MPTAQFLNARIDHQPYVIIKHPYDRKLYTTLKSHPKTIWVEKHRCFGFVKELSLFHEFHSFLIAQQWQVKMDQIVFKTQMAPVQIPIIKSYRQYLLGLRKSTSTIATYSNFVESYARFLEEYAIHTSTVAQMRLFVESQIKQNKLSVSTHRQFISAIRHLADLYPHLQMETNQLKRPKRDLKLPVVLSTQQIITLLQCTENLKHLTIIGMLYSCGLRIGELLSLEKSDVHLDRHQLHVRNAKGRKDRYVGIAKSMHPMIRNYLSTYTPQRLFVESPKGGAYSTSSVFAFLKRSCKKAGIESLVTPHTLRHTYATHMVEQGVGLRHIQELLGHSKPESTMIYTHIARKDLLAIHNPLDVAVHQLRHADKSNPSMRLSGDSNG